MTYVSLQPDHLTGIAAIDTQHAELVSRLNRLYELRTEGHGQEMLLMALADLIKVARHHFTYEERLLEQHNYEDLEAHRAEHAELLRQAEGLENELRHNGLNFSNHVMALIKDWLFVHMIEEDGAYCNHLIAQTTSAA